MTLFLAIYIPALWLGWRQLKFEWDLYLPEYAPPFDRLLWRVLP
jgi:hypothetical protein